MSGFANPLVGGGGALVYPSIHSPGYVAGSTGWSINKDGTAEFNNGTFRGVVVAGGMFIYNGTPGPGNPPVFSVATPGTTTDPYGNAIQTVVMAGNPAVAFTRIEDNGTIVLYGPTVNPNIIIDPIRSGIFFYSPTAGPGNLTASISPVSGTDVFGNPYKAGFTSYGSVEYVQMLTGTLIFGLISGGAANPAFIAESGSSLILQSGNNGTNDGSQIALSETTGVSIQSANGPPPSPLLTVNGNASTFAFAAAAAGGPVIKATSQAATNNPILEAIGTVAGDNAIGAEVAGDTRIRYRVNCDGTILWGPGNAAQDTTLYRGGAGELATSTLVADISGTPETWHPFTPAAGTGVRCAYRKTAQGDLQLTGSITYSAPTSPTSIFTLPSGYFSPVNSYGPIPLGVNTSAYAQGAAHITLSTAGLLQYFGPSSAGTITLDGITFPISAG